MFELLQGLGSWLTLAAAFAVVAFGWVGVPDAGAGGAGAGDGDAGGEGDGDAGGDGGDGGAGDEGEGDSYRQHAGGDGEDDFEDDDPDEAIDTALPEEIKTHPRFKQLRTRNRRYQRQMSALRPIVEHFRSRNSRLSAEEISRVLNRAQDMEELEPLFAQHPDLVQSILERKAGRGRTAAADADDAFVDPYADESKLPFDTSNDTGRALLALFRENAKTVHELKVANRRLERQVGTVAERDTHRTIADHERGWKSATLAAVQGLPDAEQRAVVAIVQTKFDLAKERRQLGRINPRQVIDEALAPFKRAARGRQRQSVAGQQQRAERNTTLPRTHSQGRTAAASPSDSNNKNNGTIKDGRKSFFLRIGQSAPPGR